MESSQQLIMDGPDIGGIRVGSERDSRVLSGDAVACQPGRTLSRAPAYSAVLSEIRGIVDDDHGYCERRGKRQVLARLNVTSRHPLISAQTDTSASSSPRISGQRGTLHSRGLVSFANPPTHFSAR